MINHWRGTTLTNLIITDEFHFYLLLFFFLVFPPSLQQHQALFIVVLDQSTITTHCAHLTITAALSPHTYLRRFFKFSQSHNVADTNWRLEHPGRFTFVPGFFFFFFWFFIFVYHNSLSN